MSSSSTYKLKPGQVIYGFVKAVLDFLIALIALVILAPFFLIIAIVIKLDSPGPVFFIQKRIGKHGKLFNCIKFRSMFVEARHDVASYAFEDVDSYITKVGAFMRRFSIDELPQFINILTFSMSLIGYRPSQQSEQELHDARMHYDIYQIRPGISGWAQVNGRDVLAANPKEKAEHDKYYLENFSLWLDIKIFFMTIVKVLKCDGFAEGVIKEQ